MKLEQTKIAFRKFASNVQKRTRQRASQRDVKASGDMIKDLTFDIKVSANSIEIIYRRPAYADFQDQGVSGVQKKFDTPFSYKTKRPPSHVFEKWAKQKGITPRKPNGQFMTFKAFGFMVANKVFNFGLKPRKFFTDSFVTEFNNLAIPIQKAYAKDAMDLLKTALK